MWLRQLTTQRFKLLSQISVAPAAKINLFFGDNAAGKTTFLELIATLSHGRLASGDPRLVGPERNAPWAINGQLLDTLDGSGISSRLRVHWDGETQPMLDGQRQPASRYARAMPVASINIDSLVLNDAGPSARRKFIDWQLFHVEPLYALLWNEWRRLHRQRNQAMAQGVSDREIHAWTPILAEKAERIALCRAELIRDLQAELVKIAETLLDDRLEIEFKRGWPNGIHYAQALSDSLTLDRKLGRTRLGPQRADLTVRAFGTEVSMLSRGQQKLVASALMMAACALIYRRSQVWPLLLIDDLESELAGRALARLSEAIRQYPGQAFVTAHRIVPDLNLSDAQCAMFHVEHGRVLRAVQ